jgi:hypothetical protein
MRWLIICVLALPLAVASLAADRLSSEQAQVARLDADLTPVGAERAANADGSIPAWSGGLPKTAIDPKLGYQDPFAADQPLYTITAQNAEQYKELLSAGHLTLLKRDPRTFRMKVYPTRRSAAYPDDVLAEVKKQAPLVKQDGYRVLDAGRTSVPFPTPTNGLQVMWNHVFRWRGGSVERQYVWAPVTGGGQFYVVRIRLNIAWDQHGFMDESRSNRLYNATQFFMSPPSAIGVRNAQWEPINTDDDARVRWLYVPQTVDTRRLPVFGYDMADTATNGLRLADQNDGWNGAPDKFEWKLIGKRELLIGYNAYRIADRTLRYGDIIKPRNLDPELLRYEKHRVWVVEATRREAHVFAKRIFYVDEDTWQVAQEEAYNEKGQLGRFGDHHMIQHYDVQVPWYAATIHHDLNSGAYIVSYLNNMEPFPTRWGFKGRIAEYLPSYLRVLGLP